MGKLQPVSYFLGTDEERGLIKWRKQLIKKRRSRKDVAEAETMRRSVYEIAFLTKYLKRWNWTTFLPFSPTFDEELFKIKSSKADKKKRRRRRGNDDDQPPPPSIEVTDHDD